MPTHLETTYHNHNHRLYKLCRNKTLTTHGELPVPQFAAAVKEEFTRAKTLLRIKPHIPHQPDTDDLADAA